MEQKDPKQEKGTFVGLRAAKDTARQLVQWCIKNEIPNPTKQETFHVTLLCSRKYLPDYVPAGQLEEPYLCIPERFTIWKTSTTNQTGPQTNCLVVRLQSPKIVARHQFLLSEHRATNEHDIYIPHVTLSYDVGELNSSQLQIIDFELVFDCEYHNDLKINWVNNET
jgi:hypothetical protein